MSWPPLPAPGVGGILSQDSLLNNATVLTNLGGGGGYPTNPTFGRVTANSVLTGLIYNEADDISIRAVGGNVNVYSTEGIGISTLDNMTIKANFSTLMQTNMLNVSTNLTIINGNIVGVESESVTNIFSNQSTIVTGRQIFMTGISMDTRSINDTRLEAGESMRLIAGNNMKLSTNTMNMESLGSISMVTPLINAWHPDLGINTVLSISEISTNAIYSRAGITVSTNGVVSVAAGGSINTDLISATSNANLEIEGVYLLSGSTMAVTGVSSINGINWARISTVAGSAP